MVGSGSKNRVAAERWTVATGIRHYREGWLVTPIILARIPQLTSIDTKLRGSTTVTQLLREVYLGCDPMNLQLMAWS